MLQLTIRRAHGSGGRQKASWRSPPKNLVHTGFDAWPQLCQRGGNTQSGELLPATLAKSVVYGFRNAAPALGSATPDNVSNLGVARTPAAMMTFRSGAMLCFVAGSIREPRVWPEFGGDAEPPDNEQEEMCSHRSNAIVLCLRSIVRSHRDLHTNSLH